MMGLSNSMVGVVGENGRPDRSMVVMSVVEVVSCCHGWLCRMYDFFFLKLCNV